MRIKKLRNKLNINHFKELFRFFSGHLCYININDSVFRLTLNKDLSEFDIYYEEAGYSEGYCFGTYTKNDNGIYRTFGTSHRAHT